MRRTAKEFIRFLRRIDGATDKQLDQHLIVDNYGTRMTPKVSSWLAKHAGVKLHFIPTSSSWLNLVELFFAEITGKRIRRGVFRSVAELGGAIYDYLDHDNGDPKPFVWTKTANEILDKKTCALEKRHAIEGGHQALESENYFLKTRSNKTGSSKCLRSANAIA